MKLFHWNMSQAFKRYASGDIISMAKTVEDAREIAVEAAVDTLKDSRPWWYGAEGELLDEEREEHDAFFALLVEDLAKEPRVGMTAVIIWGSQ